MRSLKLKRLALAFGSAAFVVVLSSAAFACTVLHTGNTWLCSTTNTGCANPGVTTWVNSSAASSSAANLLSTGIYTVAAGKSSCKSGATTLATPTSAAQGGSLGNGWSGVSVTIPTSKGSYDLCAFQGTDTTYHKTITVT